MTTTEKARFQELLRAYLPFLGADEPLAEDAVLRELGLDSLATVELLAAIEQDYGVRFVHDDLQPATFATPGSLSAALDRMVARTV